jgi:N utilization substance protein B
LIFLPQRRVKPHETKNQGAWHCERFTDSQLDDSLLDFAKQIVIGILPIVNELDTIIAKHAPEWPLDQVAIIDRNILRIALWEIAVSNQTPIKVAINEAVELGKVYGSDSTPRFVNGVLGSLVLQYQEILVNLKKMIPQ